MKTDLTLKLEREIYKATRKQGVFCCFEVTIGWYGKERVDYMTYDTKGIWRCYEIKVSKADFHSKNHNTFVGHFNYYVMPEELYNQVKYQIPKDIGVYINGWCTKKPKKQELAVDEQILKNSMIRSLSRETEKVIKNDNPLELEKLRKQLKSAKNDSQSYKRQYWDLMTIGREKYGNRWYKD